MLIVVLGACRLLSPLLQSWLQFLDRSGDPVPPQSSKSPSNGASETLRGNRSATMSVDVVNPVFDSPEAADVHRRLKAAVTKEAEERIRKAVPRPVRLSTALFIKTAWGLLFIMYNSVRPGGCAVVSALVCHRCSACPACPVKV